MAGVAGAGAGGGQFPATPRSAGAERLPEEEGGRSRGVRVRGWDVRTGSGSILGQAGIAEAEKALGTSHLPELFFGDSFLEMKHRVSCLPQPPPPPPPPPPPCPCRPQLPSCPSPSSTCPTCAQHPLPQRCPHG